LLADANGVYHRHPCRPFNSIDILMRDGTKIEGFTNQDLFHTVVKVRATTQMDARNWKRAFVHASLGKGLQQVAVLPMPWVPLEGNYPQVGEWTEVIISRPSSVFGRASGYAPVSLITSTLVRDPVFGALINFLGAGDIKTASRLDQNLADQAKLYLY